VNNGQADNRSGTQVCAPAQEKELNPRNELLEDIHGERLDTRAQGTASRDDQALGAVVKVNRAKK
jgi:hypothetical protein